MYSKFASVTIYYSDLSLTNKLRNPVCCHLFVTTIKVQFDCRSVCVQPHAEKYAWICMKSLLKVGLGLVSR